MKISRAPEITINHTKISPHHPTYFIADIASNHDGDLQRAKDLIYMAKEAGADAAKFQHFIVEKIVSAYGFNSLGAQKSHQENWNASVFEVYKRAECDRNWTEELLATCRNVGIEFMTSPYDFEAIETLAPYVNAYKIGSGDITWLEALEKIASLQKPVLLATGAASMEDVERAVQAITALNSHVVLMQCNTNYTGSVENFNYINLNVLKTYAQKWPGIVLGLSDHTPGHSTVLGAIALGACAIEKHFTDDNSRIGPDHAFSMDPQAWKLMVKSANEVRLALGDGIKKVEDNEKETVILQRRCIRITTKKGVGDKITKEDMAFLRPAPENAFPPYEFTSLVSKQLIKDLEEGEHLTKDCIA